MRHGEFEHQRVEEVGGDARLDMRGQKVQRLGGEPTGPAHAGESLLAVQFYVARLAAGGIDSVNKSHVLHPGDGAL